MGGAGYAWRYFTEDRSGFCGALVSRTLADSVALCLRLENLIQTTRLQAGQQSYASFGASMGDRQGKQKGATDHAEGEHGAKTHSAFIEGLHGRHGGSLESDEAQENKLPEAGPPVDGHHRLWEDREQHDEAEKNSEKARLARELERRGESPESESVNGPIH
jgi:hypothetical protein